MRSSFESTTVANATGTCFEKLSPEQRASFLDWIRRAAVYDSNRARLVLNEFVAYGVTGGLEGVEKLAGTADSSAACMSENGAPFARVKPR